MKHYAEIYLGFNEEITELKVKGNLHFQEGMFQFRFSLSTLLEIDTIKGDSELEWKIIKEWNPQWQATSNEIEVFSKSPFYNITIEYHGKVTSWCDRIEEQRIALSSYSSWIISYTSVPLESLFYIENMEDYFIIHGDYDPSKKIWIYGNNDYDKGNIIALKKGCYYVAEKDNFRFYYLDKEEKSYAESYVNYSDKVLQYYMSLYPKKEIENLDIVCLGIKGESGAYFRKGLIVIQGVNGKDDELTIQRNSIYLLGHELGHNWFMGADTNSWEDWLNETGAEWSALLYILSIGDHELFEQRLSFPLKEYKTLPSIKTSDLSRPKGVHWRGTVLFYKIYQAYGKDMIITILQILASIKEQTTENFLTELHKKIGDTIPDQIEKGLTLTDYTELFNLL